MSATEQEQFQQVGTGRAVFRSDEVVEGPVRWLDSPQSVIDFVSGGDAADTIVVARGGTTTFLTPALTAGVKGIVTLQGAPESHLGILSREYGIPCVMGVQFTAGVRSARDEVIPADGFRLRLDVREKQGVVLVEPGAPDSGEKVMSPEEQAMAEQMAQLAPLLENFQGVIPHGVVGDAAIRAEFKTRVMELDDDSIHRDLTVDEINELTRYMAWNIWDFLAARATEGESGLIPRQEYECFGCIWQWQRYAEFYKLITDKIGVDGVVELGATSCREPASKANLLHIWCTGFTPAFGRALLGELGIESVDARAGELHDVLQFMRRLYKGFWGDGPMFTSMRDYEAPRLDQSWIDRFAGDVQPVSDRGLFTKFNASTELLGFLLHFDNRSGLADSGPYPLPGGGFMIVRDHFLHDPAYHWHDVAEGLPHCITQAMVFEDPDGELTTQLMDGATLFSEPANYLQYLTKASVYVRDAWDTPASEIRQIDIPGMEAILAETGVVTDKLYRRIASMPKRDKIIAGAQVYYTEFVMPFARLAGVWEQLRDELDFHEIDPLTSESYYPLVRDGLGAQLVGKLFITGTGFPPLAEGALAAKELKPVYERFLAANQPFKSFCFAWPDLSDDQRHEKVGELASLVERVQPVVARTAKLMPQFADYGPRLTAAMEAVEDGDHAMVTAIDRDSVHTVWMELHEEYLTTLGISREQEGSY